MVCRFSIRIDRPPGELLGRARSALAEAGGVLDGDATGGRIRVPTPVGRVEGTYEVARGEILFDIRRKPLLLPCATIEAKLRELV